MKVGAERDRIMKETGNRGWKRWGPYVSERQWGTVREDYSSGGDAWGFITHEMARSKAYRWGEEGIGGISDTKSNLCLAFAFWNHNDPIIKERLFGITGADSNHGEDVKELYYYLDSSPTHSYMKMLYKYPHVYPYETIVTESRKLNREQPEFEILDTNTFDNDNYFDIEIEYAKANENDILIKIKATNRGKKTAPLTIMPTAWFRNTWCWGYDKFQEKPNLFAKSNETVEIEHPNHGKFYLNALNADDILFCDNETNYKKLYNFKAATPFCKDGINDYIVNGIKEAVNPKKTGTKVAYQYKKVIKSGETVEIKLRFSDNGLVNCNGDFEEIFSLRKSECDEFYADIQKDTESEELKMIQRQAYAGMLWSKQFYYFNVNEWIKGDPAMPKPNEYRKLGRNAQWQHLYAANLISMPDKWEYPWFAAWDLAFHTPMLARLDGVFAKRQLEILLREYYMHPNGQIPAYEWNFSDVNPPVHAWATLKVYEIDREMNNGVGDVEFLEKIFHKLLLNFTWWVNQKDTEGNNIFGGGFLGLDNIGVFDRSSTLPTGGRLEQADGTGWMAMYTLNMLRIACEISLSKPVYQDMASKFFEHFLQIAGAMNDINNTTNLWDEEDQFYYDGLHLPDGSSKLLKVRSLVGLIPLFAVEVLDPEMLEKLPIFNIRVEWVLKNRPDLANLISRWNQPGKGESRLLSILRHHRMKMLLKRMFDEDEFLSDYGVRSLSKYHKENPYEFPVNGEILKVKYNPAESTGAMFGGNSNWRGPIWVQMNYLIIDSLIKFHNYYGDDLEVEYPSNSGNMITLKEAANLLSKRCVKMFTKDNKGNRPIYDKYIKQQSDPHFQDLMLYHEYFDGDTGKGLGASHQTGWTGLIAEMIRNNKH
jgi:Glycosyl hydrolase family 63 C-terminal domain